MNIYPDKSTISVVVNFVDDNGNVIADVQEVEYLVIDSEGKMLQTLTSYDFADTDDRSSMKILISDVVNTLEEGTSRDIRVIRTKVVTTEGGEIWLEQAYGISVTDPLAEGENSFMSYRRCLKLSMDIPNLDNWESSSLTQRMSALMEAHTRICRMSFDMQKVELDMTRQNYVVQAAGRPRVVKDGDPLNIFGKVITLRDLDADDFKKLPEDFRKVLCMAQLIEANDILETDSIAERRRQGLILETIGEVKQMFSSILPAQSAVATRTLTYLSPYLSSGRKIGRA